MCVSLLLPWNDHHFLLNDFGLYRIILQPSPRNAVKGGLLYLCYTMRHRQNFDIGLYLRLEFIKSCII